ncbi:MAG: hypothetical protein JWO38_1328 [Gemmataceae bacterium]|nr:hypothetical protein [Gemmataceae bacterium]
MADTRGENESELVITYCVGYGYDLKASDEYDRLQRALKEGCRVVDIITNPVSGGGASTAYGHTSVTVLLERPTSSGDSKYVRRPRS